MPGNKSTPKSTGVIRPKGKDATSGKSGDVTQANESGEPLRTVRSRGRAVSAASGSSPQTARAKSSRSPNNTAGGRKGEDWESGRQKAMDD